MPTSIPTRSGKFSPGAAVIAVAIVVSIAFLVSGTCFLRGMMAPEEDENLQRSLIYTVAFSNIIAGLAVLAVVVVKWV